MGMGTQILNLENLSWAEPNSKFQGWELECPTQGYIQQCFFIGSTHGHEWALE
jgi:hypothetical protein